MKTRNSAARRFVIASATTEILNALFGFLFVGLTIWGIGWSFYRHGPGHGIAAVMMPPYAWYRGVAAIWDKPKWKEDYNTRTEQIALFIANTFNNQPEWQIQSRDFQATLRKWIDKLPESEKQKLLEASRSFSTALSDFVLKYVLAVVDGEKQPHPETSVSIQSNIEKFRQVAGFETCWNKLLRDSSSYVEIYNSLQRGEAKPDQTGDSKSELDKVRLENIMRTYTKTMSEKMNSEIDDLFKKP